MIIIKTVKVALYGFYMNPNPPMYVNSKLGMSSYGLLTAALQTRHEQLGSFDSALFEVH